MNKRQVEDVVGGILSQEGPIGSCSVTRPLIEVRDFLTWNISEVRIQVFRRRSIVRSMRIEV